jgi:hypothetical protein
MAKEICKTPPSWLRKNWVFYAFRMTQGQPIRKGSSKKYLSYISSFSPSFSVLYRPALKSQRTCGVTDLRRSREIPLSAAPVIPVMTPVQFQPHGSCRCVEGEIFPDSRILLFFNSCRA